MGEEADLGLARELGASGSGGREAGAEEDGAEGPPRGR